MLCRSVEYCTTGLLKGFTVDGRQIRELEDRVAAAIRKAVEKHVDNVSEETFHFMAKAAVAVLEATAEQ